LGIAVTVVGQLAMGASWRGDVDLRNPIFTPTATTATGLALMASRPEAARP
jgi:hypothetical protein